MATDNIFITLYAVHQDDSDRDSGYPKWYFTDKVQAEYVANGRGWYGGNAPISEIKTVRGIDGKLYVITSTEPPDIDIGPEDELKMKEEALSKLSPYEKKLLGL